MNKTPIFSIGYGNRKIDDFIRLLYDYEIGFVVDVRSRPYSKFNPDYSQASLERHLKANAVRYVFMGDTLGGQPSDNSCYTDGKVDYDICKSKDFFKSGIERIKKAWVQDIRVALMCSESKPQDCHRSKLIGQALRENGIGMVHIDETGKIKTQDQVISLLVSSVPGQLNLFDDSWTKFTSRKKYRPENNESEY